MVILYYSIASLPMLSWTFAYTLKIFGCSSLCKSIKKNEIYAVEKYKGGS
jgi:hypothetical protein